jgi:hypothetical protein
MLMAKRRFELQAAAKRQIDNGAEGGRVVLEMVARDRREQRPAGANAGDRRDLDALGARR